MPLALPSSAPSLGAVAGHRRHNAPVHAARQVANDDSKTHGALVQQAVDGAAILIRQTKVMIAISK